MGGFGQGDAEIVLQDPLRVKGLLLFLASVILAQIFLVLKKKQFEKVQLAEMNLQVHRFPNMKLTDWIKNEYPFGDGEPFLLLLPYIFLGKCSCRHIYISNREWLNKHWNRSTCRTIPICFLDRVLYKCHSLLSLPIWKRKNPENRDRSQEGEIRRITKQSWRRFLSSLIPFFILSHYYSSNKFSGFSSR